jgi:hypothetical protein
MRRVALAVLLALAACAAPSGAERETCAAEWLERPAVVAHGDGVREMPLPIACIAEISSRRVEVGFTLPAGPECHLLKGVELDESADAVSITLIGAVDADPNAGACPEEARMALTEIDLAAPVDDRVLLDGSPGGLPSNP